MVGCSLIEATSWAGWTTWMIKDGAILRCLFEDIQFSRMREVLFSEYIFFDLKIHDKLYLLLR